MYCVPRKCVCIERSAGLANLKSSLNAILLLAQPLRRWANIETKLGERFFACKGNIEIYADNGYFHIFLVLLRKWCPGIIYSKEELLLIGLLHEHNISFFLVIIFTLRFTQNQKENLGQFQLNLKPGD